MSEGIAYQNKDILFKILGENYREKSFSAYGIHLPPIKALLPTNLPKISADERSIDNLFLLEDGTYVIVDYEAVYRGRNKIKYLNYIARVMERYYKEGEPFRLRLIVIYTGDVASAGKVLETDCFSIREEQAFLTELDGDTVLDSVTAKVEAGEALSDDDLMHLMILPLAMKGIRRKQQMLEEVVALTERMKNESQALFVVSGVLVASDKFVEKEFLKGIRRRIGMTKFSQLLEEEKIEYGNQKVTENTREIARKMIRRNMSVADIAEVTGLTKEEIQKLQNEEKVLV